MIYFKSMALNKCLISMPGGTKQQDDLPLVLALHGGGSSPEKMIHLWESISTPHFIYAAPQGPYAFVHNQELSFDWAMWPSQDEDLIQQATTLSEEYILDAVQEVKSRYPVSKTYLMGFSQGAIFTYIAGIKHHHRFDGLVCLSGPGLLTPLKNPFVRSMGTGWLPEKFIEQANDLRVLITHGKNDQAASYELGVQSRDVLKKHGYDVTFFDFDGGHILPPDSILESIAEWITAEG